MARLPATWNDPAGSADNNSWGDTLNTYLRVEHNADGTHNLSASMLTISSLTLTTPLGVASGGSGRATLALNGVMYGNGTTGVLVTTQGAANTVLTANAGAPSFSATPTVTSLTTTGSATIGTSLDIGVGQFVRGGSSAGKIIFSTDQANGMLQIGADNANSFIGTSGGQRLITVGQHNFSNGATFAPASGSASYASLEIAQTINGTSSGTAYGLGIASKTNTLTGGAIKLASFGTTTSDLFTGYTPLLEITIAGVIDVKTGGSTTISTGVGSVKMSTANAATNTSWIPFAYNGTTYFIPGWTTNAP